MVKKTAFWDTVPSSLAEVDPWFMGAYLLHYQGDLGQLSSSYLPLQEPESSHEVNYVRTLCLNRKDIPRTVKDNILNTGKLTAQISGPQIM
jgi:hypothetical protein